MLPSLNNVIFDPSHDRRVDLLFRSHVQLVTGTHLDQLLEGKEQELFVLHHFLEAVLGKLFRDPKEFPTGVSVGEGPNSQAVRGIQLTF